MRFDWHSAKHEANLRERGFGFDFAAQIFDGDPLLQVDTRRDYGEVRIQAIGEVNRIVLFVVFTDRDDVRWVISARLANRKERERWRRKP